MKPVNTRIGPSSSHSKSGDSALDSVSANAGASDHMDALVPERTLEEVESAWAALGGLDNDVGKRGSNRRRPLELRKYTQQIWLAGLGAFSRSEDDRTGLFDSLVKMGEELESKTTGLTDQTVGAVTERVQDTYERVGKALDERVNATASRIGFASQRDVSSLVEQVTHQAHQLEQIQQQLDRIEQILLQQAR